MDKVTIVDARMGRGKTSAAITFMQGHKKDKRFLYITPYLSEVDRVCSACDFDQPDSDHCTKLAELKMLLRQKRNVVSTHSLFSLLDEEALRLVKDFHYSLIIDEGINVISNVSVTANDKELISSQLSVVQEDGRVEWLDKGYTGKFSDYKEMADTGSLYSMDGAFIYVMQPEMLRAFDSVIMMTYLFRGQYQKAYLDYYGFSYEVVGVDTGGTFRFSDKEDAPPPLDYRDLIHIVSDPRMNDIGRGKFSLSKNWFAKRAYDHPDIKTLRANLRSFFRGGNTTANDRLWTCFKEASDKLVPRSSGRYRSSFLQMSAKATNAYKDRNHVAYLVNRFLDPNIVKFFKSRGADIDPDEFALSEMLQFIWRSSIRDNKPIELYVPSERMRNLLISWIDKNSKGGY